MISKNEFIEDRLEKSAADVDASFFGLESDLKRGADNDRLDVFEENFTTLLMSFEDQIVFFILKDDSITRKLGEGVIVCWIRGRGQIESNGMD